MAQFESSREEMMAAGATVAFIAAEKRGGLFRPEKYLASHALSFPFLLDEQRTVTKAYGVYHRFGLDAIHIAHPATFIVDRQGIVRFIAVSESQTDRVDLQEIVARARDLRH